MIGFVYSITCNETGEVYIGQTCGKDRKSKHKYDAKMGKNCAATQIVDRGNYTFKVLEEIEFEHIVELNKLEGKYQIEIPNCINKVVNGQSVTTAYKDRQEYKRICDKAYREGPKREEILERKREYHHANKEAIAEKSKAYREANAEAIKEKKKAEYLKAKENGLCDIIHCECGGTYTHRSKSRHFKTAIHQKYLDTVSNGSL